MYDSKLFTMAYIYKISNSVNDKVYIGQTTYSLHDRFLDHKSRAGLGLVKSALYKAITKYGFDKFRIDSIVEGDFSKEELDALEIMAGVCGFLALICRVDNPTYTCVMA